ncbi:hypothetical protein D3C86_1904680 [compost metagenome]
MRNSLHYSPKTLLIMTSLNLIEASTRPVELLVTHRQLSAQAPWLTFPTIAKRCYEI